jgi:uncharacterized protein (UPF0332 family)
MGVAEDLLVLAGRLATPATAEPEQASLRRALSTAYYALFHLLVSEATQCWNGSSSAQLGLERAFEHRTMKEASRAVLSGNWKAWGSPTPSVPVDLRAVATTFVKMQDVRQQADYDNAQFWESADVRNLVAEVQTAFENWNKIRTDPAAN